MSEWNIADIRRALVAGRSEYQLQLSHHGSSQGYETIRLGDGAKQAEPAKLPGR